jgi:hypothetical protein
MIFDIKFKDFVILSATKERIMLWNKKDYSYSFILLDEGFAFRTEMSFADILIDYCKKLGLAISDDKKLGEAKESFEKEFILNREHTYEFFPEGSVDENYAGIVNIQNPIDQVDENTIEYDSENKLIVKDEQIGEIIDFEEEM